MWHHPFSRPHLGRDVGCLAHRSIGSLSELLLVELVVVLPDRGVPGVHKALEEKSPKGSFKAKIWKTIHPKSKSHWKWFAPSEFLFKSRPIFLKLCNLDSHVLKGQGISRTHTVYLYIFFCFWWLYRFLTHSHMCVCTLATAAHTYLYFYHLLRQSVILPVFSMMNCA